MKRFHTYFILALSLFFVGTLPILADSKAESWKYPSSNPGYSSFVGSGTASSPYLIQSAQDLANLAYIVTDNNDDVTGKYFKMTRDIYLNDFTVDANGKITANGDLKDWTPIGEWNRVRDDDFQGIFDGNGYTIYGLYINAEYPLTYTGLFGTTEDAIIKNLTLKNVYIYTGSSYNHDCVIGTLVGRALNTTVTNVSAEGCYMRNDGAGLYTMVQGGLLGLAQDDVTLTDCSFNGTIYQIFYRGVNTGGLIGDYAKSGTHNYITLRLTRCQTRGDIKVANYCKNSGCAAHVGGLVGGSYTDNKHIYITECVNRLNLTFEGNETSKIPSEFNANHYAYRAIEVKRSANLGSVYVTSTKVNYVGIFQAPVGSRYVDCVNYGHYVLPENHDDTEIKVLTGSNKIYHGDNDENLIIWKDAKPTNLGTNDQFESNGTEMSAEELNNNQTLVDKLNEEVGENVWGFMDITENGTTYKLPFPVSIGGISSSLYKNEDGQYQISSEADLHTLQTLVKNGTTTSDYYILTRDIDMSNSAPFEQIGDDNHPFIGTFDGNGNVISGITVKGRALFGNLSGTVKNLALVNMKFTGGNSYCAPFAYKAGGSADASIANCYAGGTVTLADSINKSTTLAGLIYEATDNKVSIKNSYFRGIMANATNVNNQGHFYYGIVANNKIGNSLTLADCYANFNFNEMLGIGAGLMPNIATSTPDSTNCHFLCPQFNDNIGQILTNAQLAACYKGKEGWLTGAYSPVLESARHYELTTYDGQTVYTDAIPLDDDSRRNEIFCYQATTETANDALVWALPNVAVCDTENKINYLLNCQLYDEQPLRYSPPTGSVTKGQMRFPLTFTGDYAIRLMCLPATLLKSDLPDGTEVFLMGKPTGDKAEGYSATIVACDSVPAGVPFLIYMSDKPSETIDVVLRGDIVSSPQSSGTLNGVVLESGLTGTFDTKHLDNGCANIGSFDPGVNIINEDNIDVKPFGAYVDADAEVACNTGVLLKETSNYIDETLDTYKDRTVTVLLSRNLQTSGWNTLCLPFSLTQEEVLANYGNDTRLEELTSITTEADGSCTLNFTKASSIEAGKCYLILPAVAYGRTYQFDDKTLCTEPVASTFTSSDGSYTLSFMGTFARKAIDGSDTSKGTYFTQNNKIYKVAENHTVVMSGFRCWIETSENNVLNKAKISHSDGSITNVNVVPVGTTENNHRIYDLQGIETPHPGKNQIYIKGGRKWIGSLSR